MSRTSKSPKDASDAAKQPASSPQSVVPAPPPDPPREEPASDVETALGLNSGDRRVLTVLIVVALVLMAVNWYRLTYQRPQPIEVIRPGDYHFELDVNSASWVEWMQLDRIGETLARRIVKDRQQRGPFRSVDDVQRVPGIGPKTIEAIRKHLTCRIPADPDGVSELDGRG